MIENEKFILNNDTGETIDINKEDFNFVQSDKKIFDVKFNTKPVTFFKDSLRRFAKSKSAVIGAVIVGLLAVMAIIIPSVMPKTGAYLVGTSDTGGTVSERFMQPKIFPSGTGFWDGTVRRSHVMYNNDGEAPVGYRKGTYSDVVTYEEIQDVANEYGSGGAINVFCSDSTNYGNLFSKVIEFNLNNSYKIAFDLDDSSIQGYVRSEYRVYLSSLDGTQYNISSNSNDGYISSSKVEIDINKMLEGNTFEENKLSARIYFGIKPSVEGYGNILLKNFYISSNSSDEATKTLLEQISFNDGNSALIRTNEDAGFWNTTSGKRAYGVHYTYCDLTYDQYEDVFGLQEKTFTFNDIYKYRTQKIIDINLSSSNCAATSDDDVLKTRFPIVNEDGLIYKVIEQVGDATYNSSTKKWEGFELICEVHGYKLLGYDKMPWFIFGTNTNRKDYFTLIFTGLRFSFLLAIVVSAVNIAFGLIWGSISGYFGGWTDILMERFCEILSGLPGTVIITLCILYGHEWNWGTNADVLALMLALFMTGWMGVSGRTRTQFYRFKGREYVLASRTLGAKDSRLIFKHILPNSLGTIITGSILMIPGVIYTEASIAYLKLGLTNQIMFGVILSQASSYYKGEQTYLLIIPTLIMALLLISFNLFGNGLRDAFNPTLKGSE